MARMLTGLVSAKSTSAPASALRVTSAIQGVPVPILLGGQNRLGGTIVWYGDFYYQNASNSSAGGKGGAGSGGSKGQSGSYDYFASFEIAICEGPVGALKNIWINGALNNVQTPAFFDGDYSQSPWGFVEAFAPAQALNYRGIAYTAWQSYPLGSSPSLPNFTFEIQSTNFSAIQGQPDADPSVCFSAWLTNQYWGVGFPSARLGSLAQWSSAAIALGLIVSPVAPAAVQAASFANDLLVGTNAAAKWSEGLLTVAPYYDQPISAGALTTITETHVVPATQFLNTGFPNQFVADLGVTYASGVHLTLISVPTPFSLPPVGCYFQVNGTYWFNVADVGATVLITYEYAAVASYVPNNVSVYDFTLDDFLPNQGSIGQGLAAGNSPLSVVRKGRDQMLNNVKVEYLDRSNNYNPVDIEAKDEASIIAFGRERPSSIRQHHFFCLGSAAQMSADLQLVRESIARTFQWTVGAHFLLAIELMNICTVTDPGQSLSLQPVRITEIQENADGTLTVTAEEFLGTMSTSPRAAQGTAGFVANYNADPGAINAPFIFEPTDQLGNGLEIWIAVSGQNTALWGGCDVWASSDGVNYTRISPPNGVTAARMGTLNAPLPIVNAATTPPTIDTTSTLSVDLTQSAGVLNGGSFNDILAGNTAAWLGGEVIAYETATLVTGNEYDLTTLNRGMYGTDIAAAPIGAPFVRLDNNIVKFPYTQDRVGKTVYFKFVSFNVYRGGGQNLAEVTPYTYVIQGTALTSPLPDVDNFTSTFQANITQLSWSEIADFRPVDYEIRKGTSWAAGATIGRFAHPPAPTFGDGVYWISAHSQPIAGLNVYSATPEPISISGSILPQNVKASWDELGTGATGTFTGSLIFDGEFLRSSGGEDLISAADIYAVDDVAAAIVTLTIASPGVVNWTAHGLTANQNVLFATTGSLPTGLTPLTTYYVVGASITTNSFEVSTAASGSAINFTGSQSGTHHAYAGGDIFGGGALQQGGIYTIPAGHEIDIGYVAPCLVGITWQSAGVSRFNNFFAYDPLFDVQDFFGSTSSQFVDVQPQIALSQDGTTFGDWQNYVPGVYSARKFAARIVATTNDNNTIVFVTQFVFTVWVPTRVDNWAIISAVRTSLNNLALGGGGAALTFLPDTQATAAPFNGGVSNPSQPSIGITILNWQAGDIPVITSLNKTGCTVQVTNGGVGVARNVNVRPEGY